MNPEKVGNFIKELRKRNNLTQQELADKYGVSYQAVSKWERGINLPEVSLIRQISKDFNISVDDILDGELSPYHKNNKKIILLITLLLTITIILIIIIKNTHSNNSFNFKTISSTCNEFKVSGSLAYDKNKSSIYISNINYCGGDDDTVYETIECSLYESNDNTSTKISSCKREDAITLEEYLQEVELNIDNYQQTCKNYDDNSLYLEINATTDNKTRTYKIPLNLNNNCPK